MTSFFFTLMLASVALAHNSMEEVNFTQYSQLTHFRRNTIVKSEKKSEKLK